jgi:NADPH-dependent 2,4-dienoyl-CoA reductase/sulfur reductase-like enzyme
MALPYTLGAGVTAIGQHTVTLKDGTTLPADMILMSVGVKPETALAQTAGIKLDAHTGGIAVDDRYQTSVPDIYAVGDAIAVQNQLTHTSAQISLASPANRQGRQVADILSGVPAKNQGGIGTAIVRVFDQVAATTGLNESQAQAAELNFKVVHTIGKDHAAYYPDAVGMNLKLLFDGKLVHCTARKQSGRAAWTSASTCWPLPSKPTCPCLTCKSSSSATRHHSALPKIR